ncbi:MAG: hypothetical protein HRU19_10290 [Pseudobacteriovorax sp.]|nr:hypothetical protein [Pseudobacteriovorax sp.]
MSWRKLIDLVLVLVAVLACLAESKRRCQNDHGGTCGPPTQTVPVAKNPAKKTPAGSLIPIRAFSIDEDRHIVVLRETDDFPHEGDQKMVLKTANPTLDLSLICTIEQIVNTEDTSVSSTIGEHLRYFDSQNCININAGDSQDLSVDSGDENATHDSGVGIINDLFSQDQILWDMETDDGTFYEGMFYASEITTYDSKEDVFKLQPDSSLFSESEIDDLLLYIVNLGSGISPNDIVDIKVEDIGQPDAVALDYFGLNQESPLVFLVLAPYFQKGVVTVFIDENKHGDRDPFSEKFSEILLEIKAENPTIEP